MNRTEISSTREQLSLLGIYELREIARRIGVYSPTTKKHSQLIDEIVKISKGDMEPYIPKKKLGRPPKSVQINDDRLSDIIIPKEICDIADNTKTSADDGFDFSKLAFRAAVSPNLEETTSDLITVSGYARRTQGKHFYLYDICSDYFNTNGTIIYIPTSALKCSLRDGDKVVGKALIFQEKNRGVLQSVETINGENFKEDTERSNAQICQDFILPSEHMKVFGEDVLKGSRVIYAQPDRSSLMTTMIEEAKKMGKTAKSIFFGLELPPEFLSYVANEKEIEVFQTRFGDNLEKSYDTLIDMINHVITLSCDYKEINVFIYDIVGLLETLEFYFASHKNNTVNAVQLVKSAFGLGRSLKNGNTITIFAGVIGDELQSDIIKKELSKIASCIIC